MIPLQGCELQPSPIRAPCVHQGVAEGVASRPKSVGVGPPNSLVSDMSHGHSHAHGGGHSHDDAYPDDNYNLYQHVQRAESLNGVIIRSDGVSTSGHDEASGKAACVLKPHARRLDMDPSSPAFDPTTLALSSDADEQLIVKLQFNVPVSPRKIMVVGAGPSDSHPNLVRCYVGQAAEDLDFSGLEGVTPAQVADLAVNASGDGYFNTVRAPFTNVTALALFFPSNHGEKEQTKISYIGMQGDHTHSQRMAVHAECADPPQLYQTHIVA